MKAIVGWVLACVLCLGGSAQAKPVIFLWVFDNGVDASRWRDGLSQGLDDFLSQLQSGSIDYRMAATTTDYFADAGRLFVWPTSGGYANQPLAAGPGLQTILGTFPNSSATSFWEQGLEASYRAVGSYGAQFLQENALLAVVYVSDHNDYSCASGCSGVEPEYNQGWQPYPLQRYVDAFHQLRNRLNIEARIYPLVGTPDSHCQIGAMGLRYLQLQALMGSGVSGSLCPDQIDESLSAIARDIVAN